MVGGLLALALLAAGGTQGGATCVHRYFGLPARTPATAEALGHALLARYPAGTAAAALDSLRRPGRVAALPCVVSARWTETVVGESPSASMEQITLRPRRGRRPAAGAVQLLWHRERLVDLRVLHAPPPPAPR